MESFNVGDRVRVRTPEDGQPWHTCEGRSYERECAPGSEGVVTSAHESYINGEQILSVGWDNTARVQSSRINQSCLELVPSEADLDKEALRLFGIT